MSVRWNKIWRDLWTNKSRTAIVVLAIAVGVVAFGGVFTAKEVLLADMAFQYGAIKPTSLTLSFADGVESDMVRWVQVHKGVEAARAVSGQGLVRIFTPQGSRNVLLYALEDYAQPTVNLVTPQQGVWPPERKGIVLERTALGILPYRIGDTIEVENPNGKKKNLTLNGTVHDLRAVPANLFPQLTAYVTFDTLRYLDLPDTLTQIEIRTTPDITTQEEVQTLGNTMKKELENRGFSGVSIMAEKPNKHWGEDPSNAFVTILTVIGSFSLVLSILLVYNTISATIVQQKKQIGIMKAVGGRRNQIVWLYLCMALSYGLLALAVSLPLGALMAYGNLALVTGFLNLDIINFRIPPYVLGMMVAASLAVPLTAALIPVLLGTRMTVREALSDFTSIAKAKSRFDRMVYRIRFFTRPMLLSLRNTFRQKSRLVLTLVTLTIAGSLFISVIGVRSSMMLELDNLLKLYNYDLELYFGEPADATKVISDARKIQGVDAAETPLYLNGEWVREDTAGKNETVMLLGLPPDTRFMIPTITAGRWIERGDTNKIVLSSRFIRDYPSLEVGRTIRLKINDQMYSFEVVGIYFLTDQKMAVINDQYLRSLSPDADRINSVRVKLKDTSPSNLSTFPKLFEQRMKSKGYNVAYSLSIDTIRSSSVGQFDFMIAFLLLMAGLVGVVGGLGLAGTMSLNVLERTREIGVMRSIGASNGTVFGLVVVESLVIGFISWLIAVPLSVPVGWGFSYALGKAFFEKPLTYIFSFEGCIILIVLFGVISVLASIAPARKAVGLTVKDTLSYE